MITKANLTIVSGDTFESEQIGFFDEDDQPLPMNSADLVVQFRPMPERFGIAGDPIVELRAGSGVEWVEPHIAVFRLTAEQSMELNPANAAAVALAWGAELVDGETVRTIVQGTVKVLGSTVR